MDHLTLEALRQHHPAWRLLRAEHATVIVGFLYETFVRPNLRTLGQADLEAKLEDYVHSIRAAIGQAALPRRPADYLNQWADDQRGWLRRYYALGNDEPQFDITPAAASTIEWLSSLRSQGQFVSTESRLNTVFELLRQMVRGAEEDPDARIADLQAQRESIDKQIERARRGELDVLGPAQLRERFHQVEQTGRALLTDFRQLEQNFRDLDRDLRERIAQWDGTKGELLDTLFGDRDAIADSDQGQSFRAFWDFLMSTARRDELEGLLVEVLTMDAIEPLDPDPRFKRMHFEWLDASESVQRTVAKLSGQLRKYLDDQAWLENRRIMEIVRKIEQHAIALRDDPPTRSFMQIDGVAPSVNMTMDRPLFKPPFSPRLTDRPSTIDIDVDTSALFDQVVVDRGALEAHLRRLLQTSNQVALSALVEQRPLTRGLAELIAWLGLAAEGAHATIDDQNELYISWTDEHGNERRATLPYVVFRRDWVGPS